MEQREYRIADHRDVRDFWALNTWDNNTKAAIRKVLEDGLWVYLGSTATGHTMQDGLDWLESEYCGILQYGKDDMFGWTVVRLM